MGWDGRKSLRGVILRAPLCGANKVELEMGELALNITTIPLPGPLHPLLYPFTRHEPLYKAFSLHKISFQENLENVD